MRAEEIVLGALAYNCGRIHMTMRDDARHIVNELREAGLLLEWRTDVENIPLDLDSTVIAMIKGKAHRIEYDAELNAFIVPEPKCDFWREIHLSYIDAFAIIKLPEQTNDMA